MTTCYYRPIPMTDRARPADALPLAGGWCWFDRAERLTRDGGRDLVGLNDIPADLRAVLSAPRTGVAGLSFDAPRLMGILNVTPDSFSDGGRFATPDRALDHARAMMKNGADLIDIGGESTRPGADYVAPEAEIARTVPVIGAIRAEMELPVSIDTRKAMVAEAALAAGAALINDVAALTHDPDMAAVAARAGVPVCLMHAQGDPKTMQDAPAYDDVLLDVYDFLAGRIAAAEAAGIARDRIIVDPGIGFGKTVDHNLALLGGLSLFHGLGCPILLGASRKRFIGVVGGTRAADDRVAGSVAVALGAVAQGVQMLRVHDITETKQALSVMEAGMGNGWSQQ